MCKLKEKKKRKELADWLRSVGFEEWEIPDQVEKYMKMDKETDEEIKNERKINFAPIKRSIARGIPKIAIGICVDRVVCHSVGKLVPPSANLKTRIMFRIASLGISTAATHIVSKEMDEIFDGVESTVEMIGAVRETMNEINEEEIQNDGYYEEDSEE